MDRSGWVVVLEEVQCIDARSKVSQWRDEFDPDHAIPEEDIMIERYRVWMAPDALRISVRSRWAPGGAESR
jgi:hypothetical protein